MCSRDKRHLYEYEFLGSMYSASIPDYLYISSDNKSLLLLPIKWWSRYDQKGLFLLIVVETSFKKVKQAAYN